MSRSDKSQKLGAASKLNRDPDFLDELIDQGEDSAAEFVAALGFEQAWRSGDSDALLESYFADDARSAPLPRSPRGPRAGSAGVRDFVTERA